MCDPLYNIFYNQQYFVYFFFFFIYITHFYSQSRNLSVEVWEHITTECENSVGLTTLAQLTQFRLRAVKFSHIQMQFLFFL